MANEFVARNGVIALDDSQITGSLIVTDGITGSLFGTSSFATNALTASYADNVPATASFAVTASYVNPLTQTVEITGSLNLRGTDNTSGSLSLYVENSNGSGSFRIYNNGTISNTIQPASLENESFGFGALSSLTSNSPNVANIAIGAYSLYRAPNALRNLAVGYAAMAYTTSSIVTGSTAIGFFALSYQQGGSFNTAMGYQAMRGPSTNLYNGNVGDRNTAVGGSALRDNTVGTRNNAFGDSALTLNTSGSYNTANGNRAMTSNTLGSYNTALGYDALFTQTSASNNTGVGTQALRDLTLGSNNTALGYDSGRGITTGSFNTILGANITGLSPGLTNNVVIGDSAGNIRAQHDSTSWSLRTSTSITGSLNVSQGITGSLFGTATTASYVLNAVSASYSTQALSASFASNASTATSASYAATSSYASTFNVAGTLTAQTLNVQTVSSSVVYSSGSNIFGNQLSNTQVFTGSVNITGSLTANGPTTVVGSFDVLSGEIKAGRIDNGSEGGQVSFGRASDNLTGWYIDVYGSTSTPDLRFVDVSNGSVRMTINGSGNTQMVGSLAVGLIAPSTTAGRIDASNDVVAFSTSDIRFKENIQPIENALEKLDKIGGYTFDWKTEEELVSMHGFIGHDVGVIAQEIEEILPEIVTNRTSGYKAVKYEKLAAFLIQVDKEQQEIIKDQQRQIDELRELINIYIKTQ